MGDRPVSSRVTKRPIESDMEKGVFYPPGTKVLVVEYLEGNKMIVEVGIPDATLVGGFRWDIATAGEDDLA
jgi:hypothetical protein